MTLADTLVQRAYSVEAAAAALTISRRTAYRLIAAGELRTVKLRGRRLVPAAELVRLTGSQPAAPSEIANRQDSESRSVAPPEKPQAPTEQPARVNLSELLTRVRECQGTRE